MKAFQYTVIAEGRKQNRAGLWAVPLIVALGAVLGLGAGLLYYISNGG